MTVNQKNKNYNYYSNSLRGITYYFHVFVLIRGVLHSFYPTDEFLFPHRANTALRAISDLRLADSFLARALPPLDAPSLLSATAAGFFFLTGLAIS
jgi:hypothetical protein